MSLENIETGEKSPGPTQPALTGKRANWTIAHAVKDGAIVWQVKDAGTLTLTLSAVSAENRERAAIHGFVQRISDAAAMARDSKTGASATPQAKYEAMRRLVEHYQSGSQEWSPARSSEGVGRPKGESAAARLLKMALELYQPQKEKEVIEKFVKELGAGQITALLISEQLKEAVELAKGEIARQDAENAKGISAEELLKGL